MINDPWETFWVALITTNMTQFDLGFSHFSPLKFAAKIYCLFCFCILRRNVVAADFSFSCPGIGFFGDSSDCRVYYVCTGIGKVGSPMKCDGDLAWNQDKLACEWRRNLPKDICDKKSGGESVREEGIDSGAEVEVFDPFFPTKKPNRLSTIKRASFLTSLPPPTTSRLGNLTEEDRKEVAKKLVKSLSEVWKKCRLLMSFAVLSLLWIYHKATSSRRTTRCVSEGRGGGRGG